MAVIASAPAMTTATAIRAMLGTLGASFTQIGICVDDFTF